MSYRLPGPDRATTAEPGDSGTLCSRRTPSPGIVRAAAPVQEQRTEKSRLLTAGEIEMTKTIFKDSIDYTKVKVHREEYLWFGMQPDNTAMTPNGELYFNPAHFKEDFSTSTFGDRLWFMHEMVHVWQHQMGYPVKWRGAIRIGLGYSTRSRRKSGWATTTWRRRGTCSPTTGL